MTAVNTTSLIIITTVTTASADFDERLSVVQRN